MVVLPSPKGGSHGRDNDVPPLGPLGHVVERTEVDLGDVLTVRFYDVATEVHQLGDGLSGQELRGSRDLQVTYVYVTHMPIFVPRSGPGHGASHGVADGHHDLRESRVCPCQGTSSASRSMLGGTSAALARVARPPGARLVTPGGGGPLSYRGARPSHYGAL